MQKTRRISDKMGLVVVDLLTRPSPVLSSEEREELKKVAKLLLDRLKAVLVHAWRTR